MDRKKPRIGVLLPTRGLLMTGERPANADPVITMAERADAAGLDSVWVGDSLTSKPRLEPLATLAAVATRTKRVRLGTAVMLGAMRQPVLLAQMAGTVDLISGGRIILAMGVGGAFNAEQRAEWGAASVDVDTRHSRLEELVQVTRKLTLGEEVTFHGEHFHFHSVRMEPSRSQPGGIPILLACHGKVGLEPQFQRAARLADGLISITDTPEELAHARARVHHYAKEEGRDPASLETAFYMTVNLQRDEDAAARESNDYLMLYYGANVWGNRWGPFGRPEKAAQRIKEYAQAGADTVIVRFSSFDQQGQMDTFIKEVVPAI